MSIPTIVKAGSAGDFLATVPALLGFTPSESLVLVPFTGSRSSAAMRVDVPADADSAAEFAATLIGMVVKTGADGVAVIAYSEVEHAELVAETLATFAGICGLRVVDVLRVTGAGWERLGEDDDPSPVPETPAHLASKITPGDQHAGAQLPVADAERAEQIGTATPDLSAIGTGAMLELFEQVLTVPAEEITAEDAALLVAMINRPSCRDIALVQWARGPETGAEALVAQVAWEEGAAMPEHLGEILIGHGDRPSADRLEAALTLVRHLAAHSPQEAKIGPLVAASWLAWALGRATHAEVYVREALSIDPAHSMGNLLATLIEHMTVPRWAFTK